MDNLVQYLSERERPIIVGGPNPSLEELKKRIEDIGYVFIKFTETQGGTDLGVHLDRSALDFSQADFEQPRGIVHIEGTLKLNYINVRCVADINLSTLSGMGRLIVLEDVKI